MKVEDLKVQIFADGVRALSGKGVKLNITAMMTLAQTREVVAALAPGAPGYCESSWINA